MSSQSLRASIIGWIKLLSSKEAQLDFEKSAAGDLAGDELLEVWFSSFHPETFLHRRAFSQDETEALNIFHRKFNSYASELPAKLTDLHQTNGWGRNNAKRKRGYFKVWLVAVNKARKRTAKHGVFCSLRGKPVRYYVLVSC